MLTKSPIRPAESEVDIRSLLRDDPALLSADLTRVRKLSVGARAGEFRREANALMDEAEGSSDAGLTARAGVAAYLLGRHTAALRLLERSSSPAAAYYRGLAALSLNRPADAEAAFLAAEEGGFDKASAALLQAEAVRRQGRVDQAEKTIRSVAKQAASRAEYSFQMGCVMADREDLDGAIEYFERAVDIDPFHAGALFRLGNIAATRGEEAEAIRFYERSLAFPPLHLGAMLNLGLLYEDEEQYRSAAYCFRRVLEADPVNARARLYLRDIEATDSMYYDENATRAAAKKELLLGRALADFELSVRSRNCLESVGILTLGDLTRVSEEELLAGKNFGETSLQEVRDLLSQQGLRVGENLYEEQPAAPLSAVTPVRTSDVPPQVQMLMSKPLSDLDFSVRARKCMGRLAIQTVGELCSRTADELLSTRNFGVTSLNEVRQKLGELNLTLRND